MIGELDAVNVLLDDIVFLHMFFDFRTQRTADFFFEQSRIFLTELAKAEKLITDTRRFQRPRRYFKKNDFTLTSA